MANTYDPIFAADPNNPATVAKDASITIFDPADVTMAAVTITDVTGSPLTNPVVVNKNGFGPAFQHATLDRVGWSGGGFTGYFTSYEGMKLVATDAATAAAASASAAATAADLVGAPSDSAIQTLINAPASATRVKLDATFATKSVETSKLDASQKGAVSGVAPLDAGSRVAEANLPANLAATALNATYETKTAKIFSSKNYANLPALFAAVDANGGNCIARIEPGSYTSAPFRIDQPFVTISAWGATVALANGSNDDLIKIGPDAMFINGFGGKWDGSRANQTGTSHILNFEAYTGAFRIADRSNFDKFDMYNTLTGGVRINSKRIEIQFDHSPIRDYGQYGIYMGATDCHYKNGAIGIGVNNVIIDGGANWVSKSGLYSATDYAVKLTLNAYDTFVLSNMIDNNVGGGLTAVGSGGTTLNANIMGNEFRGNSTGTLGLFPDIYLEQVRNINIVGNISGFQQGSSSQTSHAIKTGAGTGLINATANMWDSTYHTVDVYSDYEAVYSRQRRSDYVAGTTATAIARARVGAEAFDRFELRADGTLRWGGGAAALDVSLFREAADVLATNDAFKAPRITINGTAGNGYIYFEQMQSGPPSTPGASTGRIYARTSSLSKPEIVWQTPTGVEVLNITVGTTAQRPTPSAVGTGFRYYDTTIDSPIWVNAAASGWKNGAGTTV